jgi:MFS transporter, BCD family, chlorophyll transporter
VIPLPKFALPRHLATLNDRLAGGWKNVDSRFLPFADAATKELPLGRLLRLSLFQVTVGMAVVLLIGTLNRVMIVELGVPAWIVGLMVALPLVFAPFRIMVGYRSDTYVSVIGWRRVPYLAFGTMMQFGGLSIMPFALIILANSAEIEGASIIGPAAAAMAFLMVGAGLHTVQTCGLALATDLAPPEARPKVVALLCMMLLLGMVVSALVFGTLLANFSYTRLVQVIQGAAVATLLLNMIAVWKQEPRQTARTAASRARPTFLDAWRAFSATGQSKRRLFALGLGTAAFSMQDVLLEPYGGQILHLSVGQTTALTAVLAIGGIAGLFLAARRLGAGADPYRVAALGVTTGLAAFAAVIFAGPLQSAPLFACGVGLIGFGGGVFAHATLTAAMDACRNDETGFALGTWGAVQATAAGSAIALGGALRDVVSHLADAGKLGSALADPATGYSFVYHIELGLLFITLIAIGPLVRSAREIHTDYDQSKLEVAKP